MTMSLVLHGDLEAYLNGLPEDAILVYSPTSLRLINFSNQNVRLIDYREFKGNVQRIDAICPSLAKYRMVVSIGGGSPTDIAKYIASKINAQCICIPSMLSTNASSTNKVALLKGREKVTLEAKLPDQVLLDRELIAMARRHNLSGLADVLSIHTALNDWVLSHDETGEKIDDVIYNQAVSLLEETMTYVRDADNSNIFRDIEEIYKFISESGELTNLYGSGRPESGSEHIFAKALEMQISIPHGISVALGIVLMSIVQGPCDENMINCILRLGVFDELETYQVDRLLLEKVLIGLKPRMDRYTVIDGTVFTKKLVNCLLDEFEARTGLSAWPNIALPVETPALSIEYSG